MVSKRLQFAFMIMCANCFTCLILGMKYKDRAIELINIFSSLVNEEMSDEND